MRDLVYDFGADRNAVDADGDSALMYAVTGNKSDTAEVFIKDFALDVNSRNFDGLTGLFISFSFFFVDHTV